MKIRNITLGKRREFNEKKPNQNKPRTGNKPFNSSILKIRSLPGFGRKKRSWDAAHIPL